MTQRTAPAIKTEGLVDQEHLREALVIMREALPAGITRQQLADRIGKAGVSLRTVDRLVTLLEAQGARIDRKRSGQPALLHFMLRKGPEWDENVSTEARLALRLAALSLAQSGTLLWQDKLEMLEGLASQHMSSRDRRLFDNLKKALRVQGGVDDPIEAQDILEPILRALEGHRAVEAEYQAAGAALATSLKVVPYALTHDLFSGGTFLLVWDPARRLPLHLRLSRIARITVATRIGTCPEEVMERAAQYQIGGWTSGEPPFQVEALIRGAHWTQAFREAPPALPGFQADAEEGGAVVRVRFQANHELGATRWLLQFGAAAQVLGPERLRYAVGAQLRAAAAQYPAS